MTFGYISASSYVLQGTLGFSAAGYAVTFAINGTGLLLTGLVTARLARRLDDHRILGIGLAVLTVG